MHSLREGGKTAICPQNLFNSFTPCSQSLFMIWIQAQPEAVSRLTCTEVACFSCFSFPFVLCTEKALPHRGCFFCVSSEIWRRLPFGDGILTVNAPVPSRTTKQRSSTGYRPGFARRGIPAVHPVFAAYQNAPVRSHATATAPAPIPSHRSL